MTWGQAELSSLAFLVFLNTVGTLLKAALWKIHNRILLIRVPPFTLKKWMLLSRVKNKNLSGAERAFFFPPVLLNPCGSCPDKTTQYFEILGETQF